MTNYQPAYRVRSLIDGNKVIYDKLEYYSEACAYAAYLSLSPVPEPMFVDQISADNDNRITRMAAYLNGILVWSFVKDGHIE